MNTKLTLTIEKTVIDQAKKYAKSKKRSLSDLIENYLKAISQEEIGLEDELSPLIKSMKGAFNTVDNFNTKEELSNILAEKYLKE